MKKIRPLFLLPASISILIMVVIFLFSAQPGEESAELSLEICYVIAEILYPEEEPESTWVLTDGFVSFIRKAAHFTEYMLLGIPVYFSVYFCLIKKMHQFSFSLAICALYAASDEFHQLFVPRRYGLVSDVLVDIAGAAFGIALGILCIKAAEKKRRAS